VLPATHSTHGRCLASCLCAPCACKATCGDTGCCCRRLYCCRYLLVYPSGCDVANHLSLFLCVADYDKLLPGWSQFAQVSCMWWLCGGCVVTIV
jgi:hypothetical protein